MEGPRDRTGEKMLALGCIEGLTSEEKPRTWRISEKAWQAVAAEEPSSGISPICALLGTRSSLEEQILVMNSGRCKGVAVGGC